MTLNRSLSIDCWYLLFVNSGIRTIGETSCSILIIPCFTAISWIRCDLPAISRKNRRFIAFGAIKSHLWWECKGYIRFYGCAVEGTAYADSRKVQDLTYCFFSRILRRNCKKSMGGLLNPVFVRDECALFCVRVDDCTVPVLILDNKDEGHVA